MSVPAQTVTGQGPVPTVQQLGQYAVTLPGWEAITQTLYDSASYIAAGQPQLAFFATPNGQGGKTLSDTNMQLAGQLPANNQFLVKSIELKFCPTVPAVAAQNPAAFGAQAVALIINDAYVFYHGGNLQFYIGNKQYLQEAPLGRFPSKTSFDVAAALADVSTTGNNFQSRIAFAQAGGRPYQLQAPLLITASQAFNLTLNWPEGIQAITNPAKVWCVLDGIFYRLAQ